MPPRAAPAPLLVFDQEVAYPRKGATRIGKRARRIRWVQPSAAQLPNGWEHPLTPFVVRCHHRIRKRLRLMPEHGWTLWASIQDGCGQLDFDFWSWGMGKYERAVAECEGPEFERLLREGPAGD